VVLVVVSLLMPVAIVAWVGGQLGRSVGRSEQPTDLLIAGQA
jgi:hypothetical protein